MTSSCREWSLDLDEPIAGSALSDTDRWIVLQYQRPWGPKAYAQADLPPAVRHHLDTTLAQVPRSRIQLIRRPDPKPTDGLALYLARVDPGETEVQGYRLSSYEALLALDLVGLLEGTAAGERPVRKRPLFLVCTHGKRDRCCARWGVPVYDALRASLGEGLVWQSDHLGGHRFAANVLALPSGLQYGRLTADDVPALAEAHARGELPALRFYRGRCAYGSAEQAAEWYLLEALGRTDPDNFRLRASDLSDDGVRTCTFEDLRGGREHTLAVAKQPLGELAKSCRAEPEPSAAYRRVDSHVG
jgi:hypothetical protein